MFLFASVCPATPLLKAVEEDLSSPGAETKNLDTVEQIVEAFNLEVGVLEKELRFNQTLLSGTCQMIQVARRDEESEPPSSDAQQQQQHNTSAHVEATQQQWWSDSIRPNPASPTRSRHNSTNSDKNDLHSTFDSS
jgi:hypothetical protein